MANTIYVVHGFRSGCEGITQYFKTEVLARAYAAYLGGSFDGVVMWQHSAEHETGNHMTAPAGVIGRAPYFQGLIRAFPATKPWRPPASCWRRQVWSSYL
jgi:hypothetical protein